MINEVPFNGIEQTGPDCFLVRKKFWLKYFERGAKLWNAWWNLRLTLTYSNLHAVLHFICIFCCLLCSLLLWLYFTLLSQQQRNFWVANIFVILGSLPFPPSFIRLTNEKIDTERLRIHFLRSIQNSALFISNMNSDDLEESFLKKKRAHRSTSKLLTLHKPQIVSVYLACWHKYAIDCSNGLHW